MRDIMRVPKSIDALVTGDDGANQYRQNDSYSRKVFDPAIAECKPLVGTLAGEKKCNAKGDSRRGVTKIMNGICQQPYAARHEENSRLQQSCRKKDGERPLDCP